MNRIGGSPPLAPLPPPLEAGGRQPSVAGTARPQRRREDVDPQIRAAAEGLEAMFTDYMLKSMRQTVDKSELSLENSATEIYRSMLDSEVAEKTARTNGIGLADQIIAYLESRSYTKSQGSSIEGRPGVKGTQAGAAAASTGGTHAGQSVQQPQHPEHSD